MNILLIIQNQPVSSEFKDRFIEIFTEATLSWDKERKPILNNLFFSFIGRKMNEEEVKKLDQLHFAYVNNNRKLKK